MCSIRCIPRAGGPAASYASSAPRTAPSPTACVTQENPAAVKPAHERAVAVEVGPERRGVEPAGAGLDQPRRAGVQHAVEEELGGARCATAGPRSSGSASIASTRVVGRRGLEVHRHEQPRREVAALLERAARVEQLRIADHDLRAGQPGGVERAERGGERGEALGLRPGRHGGADQVHRAVLQQRAGRAAVGIAHDLGELGELARPVDAGQRERRLGGERGVAVVEADEHRRLAHRLGDGVGADARSRGTARSARCARAPRCRARSARARRRARRGPRPACAPRAGRRRGCRSVP